MSGALAPAPDRDVALRDPGPLDVVSVDARLMGGRVSVYLRPAAAGSPGGPGPGADRAHRDARRSLQRISAWADRLTRFTDVSDLSRLNADPAETVRVGPTLAAVLVRAEAAARETDGIVDATLLDARLAAEYPAARATAATTIPTERNWTIESGRRDGTVQRAPGIRFDLDGIAKGWIADRAAASLEAYRAVVVDADGDLAMALAFGESWRIAIADPGNAATDLATLDITGLDPARHERFGLATSGTSVHRWSRDGQVGHHLIDPRTGRPAVTDVVQATVLAGSASTAEIVAKQIVILGSAAGEALMDRPGVRAVVVLTDRGRVLASPSTLRWLS